MSERDDELDTLLKPLRGLSPDQAQLGAWRNAVRAQTRGVFYVTRSRMLLQMVAATVVGALIGVAIMASFGREFSNFNKVAQNSRSNATFEHSHTNLD